MHSHTTVALFGAFVTASVLAACGAESAAPTSPSPTTSSIAVTVNTPIRMGQTAQASGTATLSNGQTQAITSGWQSDSPNVATVTNAGVVSGIANGGSTIFVITGGKQGQQAVRVVPDYHGTWSGKTVVTGCTQTGAWATAKFCDDFAVGSSDPFMLSLTQTGESMTARLSYGLNANFSPVSASISSDGSSTFQATLTGLEIINASIVMNSATVGTLTGTINEVWTIPGVPGQATLAQNIIGTTRTSTTTLDQSSRMSTRARLFDRLTAGSR